jgi:hypothetical protein
VARLRPESALGRDLLGKAWQSVSWLVLGEAAEEATGTEAASVDIVQIVPKDQQPQIFRLYRISTPLQEEHPNKSFPWGQRRFQRIYDGTAPIAWPDEIPKVLDEIGAARCAFGAGLLRALCAEKVS